MSSRNLDRDATRSLAVVSAVYGAVSLLFAALILAVLYRHPHASVDEVFRILRFNPHRMHPEILARLVNTVGSIHLAILSAVLCLYSVVRAIEFYGLWFMRTWGELFCALSAAVYLPFEFFGMIRHLSLLNVASTLFNIALIFYMLHLLKKRKKNRNAS